VIIPKLISIDTSIFGKIAKDYYCNDKRRSEEATRLVEYVIEKGFIPFLSFHHIQEILQHENDTEVFNRWSLIKHFPMIAWFCSHDNREILGSIFDIHLTEVKHLVNRKKQGLKSLLSDVKDDLIKYSSGEDFINQFEFVYCQLRDLGLVDNQRSKAIESLSHIRDKNIDKIKLSELNSSKLKSPSEVKDFFNGYAKRIEISLIEKGDQKLSNHTLVAQQFVEEVKSEGESFYKNDGSSLLEKFVSINGVKLRQINPKTTVGDLGYLAIYNSKMRLIAKSLKLGINEVEDLSQDSITSWVIWREIDKMIKNEPYAHGSNIVDKHMLILALYIDVFIVDKRINEYFRQLKGKMPILSKCFNNIVKLSHHSELRNFIWFMNIQLTRQIHSDGKKRRSFVALLLAAGDLRH
jgi:transposase